MAKYFPVGEERRRWEGKIFSVGKYFLVGEERRRGRESKLESVTAQM